MSHHRTVKLDLDPHLAAALDRVRAAGGHRSGAATIRALILHADETTRPIPQCSVAVLLDAWRAICPPGSALACREVIAHGADALAPILDALADLGRPIREPVTAQALGMALRAFVGRRDEQGRRLAVYRSGAVATWGVEPSVTVRALGEAGQKSPR